MSEEDFKRRLLSSFKGIEPTSNNYRTKEESNQDQKKGNHNPAPNLQGRIPKVEEFKDCYNDRLDESNDEKGIFCSNYFERKLSRTIYKGGI